VINAKLKLYHVTGKARLPALTQAGLKAVRLAPSDDVNSADWLASCIGGSVMAYNGYDHLLYMAETEGLIKRHKKAYEEKLTVGLRSAREQGLRKDAVRVRSRSPGSAEPWWEALEVAARKLCLPLLNIEQIPRLDRYVVALSLTSAEVERVLSVT